MKIRIGILGVFVMVVARVGTAQAATYTTAATGAIDESATWTGSPVVPTSGTSDINTWVVIHSITAGAGAFAGETLQLDSAGRLDMSGDLSVRDVVLNGGQLAQDNSTRTLTGGNLTLASGDIAKNRKNNFNLNFDSYSGDGTIRIGYWSNNPNANSSLAFQSGNPNPMTGFTGTLQVDVQNGTGNRIQFDFDVTTPTFDVVLGDARQNGSTTLPTHGRWNIKNDVSVTSLLLQDWSDVELDPINDPGTFTTVLTTDVSLAPGTYSYADLVTAGYGAFFTDGDSGAGTITVGDGTPPPGEGMLLIVK